MKNNERSERNDVTKSSLKADAERGRRAMQELQEQAKVNFPNGLTEEEIQAEIDAARREACTKSD